MTNNQSESLTIAATETKTITGGFKILQSVGITLLWFGADSGALVATKGFLMSDGDTFEPFDAVDGDVQAYSLAGATLHIVR